MSDERKRDDPVPSSDGKDAADRLGQDEADTGTPEGENRTATTGTIKNPGGLASGLQLGGTIPGKSPGASAGSIGTGGGTTAGAPTGTVKRTI
jgi:hypothetical protein